MSGFIGSDYSEIQKPRLCMRCVSPNAAEPKTTEGNRGSAEVSWHTSTARSSPESSSSVIIKWRESISHGRHDVINCKRWSSWSSRVRTVLDLSREIIEHPDMRFFSYMETMSSASHRNHRCAWNKSLNHEGAPVSQTIAQSRKHTGETQDNAIKWMDSIKQATDELQAIRSFETLDDTSKERQRYSAYTNRSVKIIVSN
jgi:hypothetical protein